MDRSAKQAYAGHLEGERSRVPEQVVELQAQSFGP